MSIVINIASRWLTRIIVAGVSLLIVLDGSAYARGWRKSPCRDRRAPAGRALPYFGYEPTHWRPWPEELLGCRPDRLDPHPYDRRPTPPKPALKPNP